MKVCRTGTRERLFNLYKADRAEYEQRKAQKNQAKEAQATDAERNARQVLKSGPASTLEASQLRERIAISRNLLSSGDLTATTSSRLKRLMKADKIALNRHQNSRQVTEAERNARELLDNARSSENSEPPRFVSAFDRAVSFSVQDLKRRTRRDLEELVQSDRNALENFNQETELTSTERQARRLLADNQTPNRMDGGVLRERIRQTRTLLQDHDITRNTRRKLQARLERDQKELRTRDVDSSQKSHADDLARQLLGDTRSARNLTERRLQVVCVKPVTCSRTGSCLIDIHADCANGYVMTGLNCAAGLKPAATMTVALIWWSWNRAVMLAHY